ncbi:MAG: hypothetical protein ACOCV9_00170 [Marinilabiliaceae bacterium]
MTTHIAILEKNKTYRQSLLTVLKQTEGLLIDFEGDDQEAFCKSITADMSVVILVDFDLISNKNVSLQHIKSKFPRSSIYILSDISAIAIENLIDKKLYNGVILKSYSKNDLLTGIQTILN